MLQRLDGAYARCDKELWLGGARGVGAHVMRRWDVWSHSQFHLPEGKRCCCWRCGDASPTGSLSPSFVVTCRRGQRSQNKWQRCQLSYLVGKQELGRRSSQANGSCFSPNYRYQLWQDDRPTEMNTFRKNCPKKKSMKEVDRMVSFEKGCQTDERMINTAVEALRTTYMVEEEKGPTSVCVFPVEHKESGHHHLVSCHKGLESESTQERGLFLFLIPFSALVRSYFADKFLSD